MADSNSDSKPPSYKNDIESQNPETQPLASSSAAENVPPEEIPKKGFFAKLAAKKAAKDAKPPEPMISAMQLWRFATSYDKLLISIACLFSIGIGAIMPASILVLGQFLDDASAGFGGLDSLPNIRDPNVLRTLTSEEIEAVKKLLGVCPDGVNYKINMDLEKMYGTILIFLYFGIAIFVAGYFSQMLWVLTGENQTKRIREKYVHAILRQDLGWFDKAEEGSLTTRLAQDTQLIQEGISEKAGLTIQSLAGFVAGMIVAFVKGWNLALVLLAAIPVLGIVGTIMVFIVTKYVGKGQDAYADAGAIAEQVIGGIRTVYSFSLESRFQTKYNEQLEKARRSDMRKGQAIGAGFGLFMLTLFATYGLAFWYGSRLVLNKEMTPGTVIVVFMSILIGAMSLITLPTNISAMSSARGAAYKIYATIDRVPEIDVDRTDGEKPETLKGSITFSKVSFAYPSRPDIQVLNDLSLEIKPGMTVAFVGPSGSGKSTSVALVQRFYDALEGSVSIDGIDIKDYNVNHLRQFIGVVSQEPVLFNTSIKQNILLGSTKPVTEDDLIAACKLANCHNFIMSLPDGYDTNVGEHGGQLSGGQKQRIAIARALIRDPKILLLDEATSALDTQSERIVQRALDAASKNRTTIVIAHRLSTIRNADLIVVMSKGVAVERGTHKELIELGGIYASLVQKQKIKMEVEKTIRTGVHASHEATTGDESEFVSELEEYGKIDDTELNQALQDEAKELAKSNAFIATDLKDETGKTVEVYLKLDDRDAHKELEREKRRKLADEIAATNKQGAPVKRVLMLMKPEWPLMGLGVLGASVAGVIFPVFALIFSKILTVLNQPKNIDPGPFQGANLYSFAFVLIGVGACIAFATQVYCFEAAGASMTKRLRAMAFDALMKQEIGFYDEPDNSLGALTSQLATDASKVGDLVTKVWGDLAQLVATSICGGVIAFYHGWQLTLIILCIVPLLGVGTYFESRIHRGHEDATKRAYEDAGEIASEAIKQIRTVSGLNRQKYFEDRFSASVSRPHSLAVKKAFTASLANGSTQAAQQLANALGFYAGLRLADICIGDMSGTFTVLMAVMITAQGLGRGSGFTLTFSKAKIAAIKTFAIIDRASKIDPDKDGYIPETMDGDFEFKNISFTYPARPTQPIFTGEFNISGKKNTTIALVGPSGCGKSTTIGMLQRWYDCNGGDVSIDGKNVKDYQLIKGLRHNLSIVGQEPVLFDMSIKENIAAGCDRDVTDQEIDEAAKMANIYEFIKGLPNGYDTRVGDAGSQLSGGQKQRVAIARAMIRNPRILLLDEATSALDSESEKMVQEAIDKAVGLGGRTTITIAHRLSTIQDSDVILVVKDGKIVEQGAHFELLRLDGVYAALVQEQTLNALQ